MTARPSTRGTYLGAACARCGGVERYTSNRTCRRCSNAAKDMARHGRRAALEAPRAGRTDAEASEAEYAQAQHVRVRWVFEWRGPGPSPGNSVTGD